MNGDVNQKTAAALNWLLGQIGALRKRPSCVKVRTRTLRPSSSRRFAVMVDLPFGRPKSFNAELLSGLPGPTAVSRRCGSAEAPAGDMARGVYLIGSKLAQRVRAVQIVDCAGNLNYSPAKGLYFAKNRTGIQNAAMAARCGGVVIHE
jgi:hypothetical protein